MVSQSVLPKDTASLHRLAGTIKIERRSQQWKLDPRRSLGIGGAPSEGCYRRALGFSDLIATSIIQVILRECPSIIIIRFAI